MAYTRKYNAEAEKKPFATRLRNLAEGGKYSQAEIANYVGCTPQAIGAYMRGETIPKLTDAQSIANFFNVSLEYLSGESNIKTKNKDIQDICFFTGLSEDFVKMCNAETITESTSIQNFLSTLGTNANIEDLIAAINKYYEYAANPLECLFDLDGKIVEMEMLSIVKSYATDLFWKIINEEAEQWQV